MLVPAALYGMVNFGHDGAAGWGIPMATDIAFAVGLLALAVRQAPTALKVFLLALAIVDDLGAILVIAVFYTDTIHLVALLWAAVLIGGLVVMRRAGVRHPLLYVLPSALLWLAVLESGVHATITGVILAVITPGGPGERSARESPLDRLEGVLHPWASFAVLPLFALANCNVALTVDGVAGLTTSRIGAGIILGLVVGKPVGILLGAWVAVRLRFADLPARAGWRDVAGVALLGGIGFTVAIFISGLAFEEPRQTDEAKAAIFVASLLAALLGIAALRLIARIAAPGSGSGQGAQRD
jgi:NhaA family Na+:H+ antiporter